MATEHEVLSENLCARNLRFLHPTCQKASSGTDSPKANLVNCKPEENREQKTENMPERHKIREAGSHVFGFRSAVLSFRCSSENRRP
jgi:hypothetical protein